MNVPLSSVLVAPARQVYNVLVKLRRLLHSPRVNLLAIVAAE